METMSAAERKPGTTEGTALPTFDPSKATAEFRAAAEKGVEQSVEQSKEVLAKFKAGSEDAQKALESSFETAKAVGSDLSLKTIAILRANTEATFSHFEALATVKSPAEFVDLQTAFVSKQVETAVQQTKELQAVTTKAVEDLSKPIKSAFEKALKDLKAA
ncbi:phasin [Mesorhizobium sp.]|uniref:phasin n=1 Tax=Mesorhizobium sp. TaxID=1871066 RepID=UPI000FE3CFFA|nr:phasin [Mesorhizobium sp.]RWA62378.1 MAG: phasin [Mesorhizobium sp.]RWB94675.1 MAG: phasin [Mesorhizobium sp.]RWG83375.1 MAG: phasin [Mesorhizobium sp.]RWK03293.1 MAG: phasin [Mesorhizobium sp.]RWK14164.1 MAG: phasin [Mesorhizobium sp.]